MSGVMEDISTLFSIVIGTLTNIANSLIDGLVKTNRGGRIFPLYRGVVHLKCTANVPLVTFTLFFRRRVVKTCARGPTVVRLT